MPETPSHCRLYLVFASPAGLADRDALRGAITAHDVASALLACAGDCDRDTLNKAVSDIQAAGCAVLVPSDCPLVGADGWHLSDVAASSAPGCIAERKSGTSNPIVGLHAGNDRHLAMLAGEAGADYVAFDWNAVMEGSGGTETDGHETLVHWWADLFETPVVAWNVASTAEAVAARDSGADFIALTIAGELDTDARKLISAVGAALAKVAS